MAQDISKMDILIYLDWSTTGMSLQEIASKHNMKPADVQRVIKKVETKEKLFSITKPKA